MEKNIIYIYVLMALVAISTCQEPQCSRFHYEEQLLVKMVRMEHKFEVLEKQSQDMFEEISVRLDTVKTQYELKGDTEKTFKKLAELSDDKETTAVRQKYVWFMANSINRNNGWTSGRKLVFPTTVADESNTYNNQTGEFTAPLDGLYSFSVQICVSTGMYIRFEIVISGIAMASTLTGENNYIHCITSTALGNMRSGDKAFVQPSDTEAGSPLKDHNYFRNSFSGFCISK